MRSLTLRRLGVALLLVGLITTAVSIYLGSIKFYLVVIIPVLTSDVGWGSLPLLAVFAGIVLMMIGPAIGEDGRSSGQEGGSTDEDGRSVERRTGIGGVVLIGPIPIIFGTDRKMTLIAAALAIIILAIVVLLLPR
jgi:uncharacterized protein (TIGR00304 family)